MKLLFVQDNVHEYYRVLMLLHRDARCLLFCDDQVLCVYERITSWHFYHRLSKDDISTGQLIFR